MYTTRTSTLVRVAAVFALGIALAYAYVALTPLGRAYKWDVDQPRLRRIHLSVRRRRRHGLQ